MEGALAAAFIAGIAGCAAEAAPVNDEVLKTPRFLRYTLRTEPSGFTQRAFRSNYLAFAPAFKPGDKVDFLRYSSNRVDLSFNGINCSLYHRDMPFPTDSAGIRKLVEKHFATTKEELNLEALDANVRKQVETGVAAIGMTKEQVFLALGFPSHINNFVVADDLTREQTFESNQWIYRNSEIMFWTDWYTYFFNNDGVFIRRTPP